MGYMCLFQFWFPQRICLEVELLDHMAGLFLVFCVISMLFSIVAVPVYIPTNSAQGFLFLHILTLSFLAPFSSTDFFYLFILPKVHCSGYCCPYFFANGHQSNPYLIQIRQEAKMLMEQSASISPIAKASPVDSDILRSRLQRQILPRCCIHSFYIYPLDQN